KQLPRCTLAMDPAERPFLTMLDPRGAQRLGIEVQKEGGPYMYLCDVSGRDRLAMMVNWDDNAPVLALHGAQVREQAVLAVPPDAPAQQPRQEQDEDDRFQRVSGHESRPPLPRGGWTGPVDRPGSPSRRIPWARHATSEFNVSG